VRKGEGVKWRMGDRKKETEGKENGEEKRMYFLPLIESDSNLSNE